jgi:hypothetical protein
MRLLVTSASGRNGDGYGALLSFDLHGKLSGRFSEDRRITDPRGLRINGAGALLYLNSGDDRILALDPEGRVVRDTGRIAGLDPGGGNFGPDGRYYVGLRGARTIMAFPAGLDAPGEYILARGIVPFPRGFAFGADGRLFFASGMSPSGEGDNTILVFAPGGKVLEPRFVADTGLSPLDLTIAPNGNLVVSSECPFGAADAVTSVREYDAARGRLVRVFLPDGSVGFRKPRGLRFGPEGHLYCVARDEVVTFDFRDGRFLGAVVRMPRLNGQALEFL